MLHVTRKLIRPVRLLVGLCTATLAASGCELKPPKLGISTPDGGIDVGSKLDVKATLRSLFPSLSDKELSDLSGKLSLSDAAALRSELTEVRKSVAKFSAGLFKTASDRVTERSDALRDHNDGYPNLDKIIQSSCRLSFDAELSADAQVELTIDVDGTVDQHVLEVVRL